MSLRNFVRLCFSTMFLFLLMNGAASYAQSKSPATSITVYQDPG
jgi:hypothetical protein